MKAKNIFLKTSFLMLVLLFFSFLFHLSSKPAYALTGHRIVPLVFYGNNSNYPDDNYLNKLNAALSTIQGYYRNLLGETFYFEPARRYFANSSKEYFGNTDYFGCGEIRVFCNVESEMIFNEKDTLKLFGVSNSGFGWSDRAVMVFTHDTSGTSDYAWGYTYMPTNTSLGVTWAIFNDPVLNSIAGDPGTCSATIVAQHYTNAICGIVAHELGHEFGLPHSCDVQADLMCPTLGASGTDTFPYATLRSIDQVTAKNSPFTYLTSDPNTGPPGFCFSSDSINSWCTGAGVFHLKVGSTSYPTSGTSSSITNTNPDCCRSNYSPRVTLGGFILEWCIANTTRGSPY
ncbi:MAG TPA: M12 family metallo-peptidase, partial [Candidatus Saccharimonadales bacterium]|nr:M12 family metallo-peptidase [Candidatus Saccharimonadales bacterium]